MWLRLLAGVVVLTVSSASSASAEQFRLGPIYTDRPGEVSAVVEFTAPPGPLPPSYFRLVASGQPPVTSQEIKSFQDSGQGLALIICVDVSRSMGGRPLADTKEALLSFIGKARPQDHIALVSFANTDTMVSPFDPETARERERLTEAVRNLKPAGKQTKLRQTLYKTLDKFEGAQVPK